MTSSNINLIFPNLTPVKTVIGLDNTDNTHQRVIFAANNSNYEFEGFTHDFGWVGYC